SLQHEFPRLPGIFPSLHSCHLPDYGPLVVITVQPPALYLTRPVLQELEKRQRLAEQQAQVFRQQIDRASQIIKLKAREAELMQQITMQSASKKSQKTMVPMLQQDLADVRRNLGGLQVDPPPG